MAMKRKQQKPASTSQSSAQGAKENPKPNARYPQDRCYNCEVRDIGPMNALPLVLGLATSPLDSGECRDTNVE